MNKKTIEQRVIEVVVEQLGWDKSEVTAEKDIVHDLIADSLDQLELMMGIEEEFDIELLDFEAKQVRTVAEAIALVKRYAPAAGDTEMTGCQNSECADEIRRLKALLVECRSSVKFDLLNYERMSLAYRNIGPEGASVEAEAQRLHALLEKIDALELTTPPFHDHPPHRCCGCETCEEYFADKPIGCDFATPQK